MSRHQEIIFKESEIFVIVKSFYVDQLQLKSVWTFCGREEMLVVYKVTPPLFMCKFMSLVTGTGEGEFKCRLPFVATPSLVECFFSGKKFYNYPPRFYKTF